MDDVLFGGARLLADIGGAKARFALQRGPGRIEEIAILACADYATLGAAVRTYLSHHPGAARELRHAVIALADPVDGDCVRIGRQRWQFSVEAMRRELGLTTLLVANDCTVLSAFGTHARYPVLTGAAAMLDRHLQDARAAARRAPIDSVTLAHHV